MRVFKSVLSTIPAPGVIAASLIAVLAASGAAFAADAPGAAPAAERHGSLFHHGTASAPVGHLAHARHHRPAPVSGVVVSYDPTRYGINRYSRPAYLGYGRLPAVTYLAPWEPYVDGGSVIGRPVYTLAPALVAAPLAPVYRPVWRHYHHGWHAARY
jgi:hypothetical protein